MRVRFAAVLGMGLVAGCGSDARDGGESASSSVVGVREPAVDTSRVATTLAITEVAAFQNLKATLAKDGVAVPHAVPVLAGRSTLIRVYVEPTSRERAPARPVTAVLEFADADGRALAPLTATKTVEGPSSEAVLDSTFNFDVPGGSVPVGATFHVTLVDPGAASIDDGVASRGRFPADGTAAALDVTRAAETLSIVIVPIQLTGSDGAPRLPDTSPAQLERYRKELLALYPLQDVTLSVHAPLPWTQGFSIGKFLQATVALRSQDAPPPNTYYYGSFAPTATFAEYCSTGCVTGLSGVLGPDNVVSRASVGVGFTGSSSARTMAHEVGHAHGRRHSPCGGPAGPDPAYPHAGASVGVWAFDTRSGVLVDPAVSKDVMSYCRPHFISDYTYGKLLDRLTHVNAAAANTVETNEPKTPYRFIDVGADGTLTWGERVELPSGPAGEPRTVRFEDAAGRTVAEGTAHLVEYDHLPGGFLFVPEQKVAFARIRVDGLGSAAR